MADSASASSASASASAAGAKTLTAAPGCDGTAYEILKKGSGLAVQKGATVTVHATGVVKETGKKGWRFVIFFAIEGGKWSSPIECSLFVAGAIY